jgi:MraZ protein
VASPPSPQQLEPPQVIYTARVDLKGRLKLPTDFVNFLRTFPEQQYFITTLNGDTARVYNLAVWKVNKKILAEYTEDPEAAEDIAFLADYYGGISDLDSQGRVLIPPVLRRKLGIEDRQVFVRFYNDAVDVYSEEVSEKRLERATKAAATNLPALRKKGLK